MQSFTSGTPVARCVTRPASTAKNGSRNEDLTCVVPASEPQYSCCDPIGVARCLIAALAGVTRGRPSARPREAGDRPGYGLTGLPIRFPSDVGASTARPIALKSQHYAEVYPLIAHQVLTLIGSTSPVPPRLPRDFAPGRGPPFAAAPYGRGGRKMAARWAGARSPVRGCPADYRRKIDFG